VKSAIQRWHRQPVSDEKHCQLDGSRRDLYEQHGVKEYWLIDPEAGTVEFLHLESDAYRLAGRWRAGESAKSHLLNSFQFPVSDLVGRG